MKVSDIYELYKNDAEVKDYIDKYCKSRNIFLHEAVLHRVIHEYVKYLLESREGKEQCKVEIMKTTTNIACGVDES